jgi:flagellar hook-associated protein 1 FlgK
MSQAETITNRLNYVSQEIQKQRVDADRQIAEEVKTINSLTSQLNDLNDEIVKYSVTRYNDIADLQDQRDQVLRALSEKLDITYFTRQNGQMVVQTTEGVMLVDDEAHQLYHNAIISASPTTMYRGAHSGN